VTELKDVGTYGMNYSDLDIHLGDGLSKRKGSTLDDCC